MRVQSLRVAAVPVVGEHGKLVGIVTVDDLLKNLAARAGSLADLLAREQAYEQRNLKIRRAVRLIRIARPES